MDKYPQAGEVRGKGLMLGLEMVKDKVSKEPASQELLRVLDLAKERGLLLGKGGMAGNVIRIKPPLCVTKEDADFIAETLESCFKAL